MEAEKRYLTDLDGKLEGYLAYVRQTRGEGEGAASVYQCDVEARYNRELMAFLSEGMLIAVPNYRSRGGERRYTLMEVVGFWPEHYGLKTTAEKEYYPFREALYKEAVKDWEREGADVTRLKIRAIPINYDLVFGEEGAKFERGWSQPILGAKVFLLTGEGMSFLYNSAILKKMGMRPEDERLSAKEAKSNPRLGTLRSFEEVPFLVSLEKLIRYHCGIFAFTGGGKSNLVANIVRRILWHVEESKVVVFDIQSEYLVLLLDLLSNEEIPSLFVTDEEIPEDEEEAVERLYEISVKPDTLLDRVGADAIKKGISKVIELGRVNKFLPGLRTKRLTYGEVIKEIESYALYVARWQKGLLVRRRVRESLEAFMREQGKGTSSIVGPEINEWIASVERSVKEIEGGKRGKLSELLDMLREVSQSEKIVLPEKCVDVDALVEEITKGDRRLFILNITRPDIMQSVAQTLCEELLMSRKREFRIKPYIFCVFDEAQNFIPKVTGKGTESLCSLAVENLMRQGRKYGLGVCIASQRIAGLNTSALQQLHTIFLGILPRPYDRLELQRSFDVPSNVVDLTLQLGTGEWVVCSYNATGLPNVPIFMRADNSEDAVVEALKSLA